jgi:hypothetical protein
VPVVSSADPVVRGSPKPKLSIAAPWASNKPVKVITSSTGNMPSAALEAPGAVAVGDQHVGEQLVQVLVGVAQEADAP